MSYKEKPILKIYEYKDSEFKLIAMIDDYQSCSWERNKYQAGEFSVEINFNIPNAETFQKNLFIKFDDSGEDFGVITKISNSIGSDGKGSQMKIISGYDARYLLKRRIVKYLNDGDAWRFTGSGELCIRNLIYDQCGEGAEEKRQLPIENTIGELGIGFEYSVSEAYSNLYDVCVTIATQTEIGWKIVFENSKLILKFYDGEDLSKFVRFDTDYDSLANGDFEDSTESYCNAIYIGGQGSSGNRDIYEGESLINKGLLLINDEGKLIVGYKSRLAIGGQSPTGLDRFESFDNASNLTTEDEYVNESKSMLSQYAQSVNLSGGGLAKCPYIYKENYNVGDIITVSFSNIIAEVQILSITEHWSYNQYDIDFEFGKPISDLGRQLNILVNKIQSMTESKESSDNVMWYNLPEDTEMIRGDTVYSTIGFKGVSEGTFKIFYNPDSFVGAKTYHVYVKQLTGQPLTLTTGYGTDLTLDVGTYVTIIYVDEDGNIIKTI